MGQVSGVAKTCTIQRGSGGHVLPESRCKPMEGVLVNHWSRCGRILAAIKMNFEAAECDGLGATTVPN